MKFELTISFSVQNLYYFSKNKFFEQIYFQNSEDSKISKKPSTLTPGHNFQKKVSSPHEHLPITSLKVPCKEFLISWFLPPNNLGGKKSVKFFWKCKFRVYNAVSSLGIGVRKRVTRYNWHGIKPHAVSICHFSQKAKNQLHARCHMCEVEWSVRKE